MNIPIEVGRAQGKHGIKGATHGIKGRRPRLDLSPPEERAERRRKQKEAYRRRKGIPPKATKTAPPKVRRTNWAQAYYDVWGKPPGCR